MCHGHLWQSMSQMEPTEKAMAPHSSTLAWKIPRTEEPGGPQSMGSRRESDTTKWLHFHFSLSCIGGGNGTPLQCSCLENPRDEGAWWAAVYGVAQSRIRLKWLSSSSWNLWTLFQIDVFKVENKIDDVTKESSLHLNIIHELLKYNVFIYVLLYSFNK